MSEELAIVIMVCTGFVCASGVLILRPISRRLGTLLDAVAEAKLRPSPEPEMARLRETLNRIDGRLDQLEERQDFAEAVLSASDTRPFPGALPRVQERN